VPGLVFFASPESRTTPHLLSIQYFPNPLFAKEGNEQKKSARSVKEGTPLCLEVRFFYLRKALFEKEVNHRPPFRTIIFNQFVTYGNGKIK